MVVYDMWSMTRGLHHMQMHRCSVVYEATPSYELYISTQCENTALLDDMLILLPAISDDVV